jgi:hypothetical protein
MYKLKISHFQLFEVQFFFKKTKTSCLFYISYFTFYVIIFLNFVVHKIKFEIIKSRIVVLTVREKIDVTYIDLTVV